MGVWSEKADVQAQTAVMGRHSYVHSSTLRVRLQDSVRGLTQEYIRPGDMSALPNESDRVLS